MIQPIHGLKNSLARRPGRIRDLGKVEDVEGKHRAHFRGVPNLAREFHQRPQFGGAPRPASDGRNLESRMKTWFGWMAAEPKRRYSTGCRRSSTCGNHRAEVPHGLPRYCSPTPAKEPPLASYRVILSIKSCFALASLSGDGNRLLLGYRRLQPTLIDRVEVRQAGDKLREPTRVVGLRRVARLPPKVEFRTRSSMRSAQFGSKTTDRFPNCRSSAIFFNPR